jgi:hypothetical protein
MASLTVAGYRQTGEPLALLFFPLISFDQTPNF